MPLRSFLKAGARGGEAEPIRTPEDVQAMLKLALLGSRNEALCEGAGLRPSGPGAPNFELLYGRPLTCVRD